MSVPRRDRRWNPAPRKTALARKIRRSMHHEHGDISMRDYMPRHAANEALAQAAAAITANDQQIHFVLLRGLKQRLADPAIACIDQPLSRTHSVERQIL